MNFRILLVALTAYLSTLLSGCFYGVDQRPAEWPPTEAQVNISDCPDIEGHYENTGISSMKDYTVHLGTLFSGILLSGHAFSEELDYAYSQYPDLISSIKISQTRGDQLQITAYSPYMQIEIEKTLSHDKGDFECTEDGVALNRSEIPIFWLISAIFRQNRHVLNRTQDRSLLIQTDVWTAAYHALIPLGGHIRRWSLFKKCCSDKYQDSATGKYLAACEKLKEHYANTDWCLQNLAMYTRDDDNIAKIRNEAGAYCPTADRGHADAQRHIGNLYFYGLPPLKRNPVEAYVWYGLATRGGDPEAKELLNQVTSELTLDQLLKAKNRLETWAPGYCMNDLLGNGSQPPE